MLFLVTFSVSVMLFWILLLVVVLNFCHFLLLLFSSTLRKFILLFWNKNIIDSVEVTSDRSSSSHMFFKRWPWKFCHVNTKTPVLESLFHKVALKFFIKKRLRCRYFPVNMAKFLRIASVMEYWWLLSTWPYYVPWMINVLIMCYVVSACFCHNKFADTNEQI